MKKRLQKTINKGKQSFPVILTEEVEGGYFVTNPAFEGCYSQGETVEEALANIQEATELCLEESVAEGEEPKLTNVSLHLINV